MRTVSEQIRYKAFISYSHRDSKAATWLHRHLESYRLPRALRAGATTQRLNPVFRDRDELASAAALSESIQGALDASAALIVICSPAAAQSRWVNEEIRYFRLTHPGRKLLAFIVDGDPGADPLRTPGRACFPSNLLLRDIHDAAAGTVEPAAPDARKEADGRQAAFLKLVAGLLDVPFDRLRQRELRRQQQRWMVLGAASLALSAVFAALAWQALVARDAARVAQARAELEADTARQTSDFMISLFEVSEPGEARGNTITAREVLDRGVQRIEATAIAKPLIKSRLLGTMGEVYVGLGLYARARELLGMAEAVVGADARSDEEFAQRIDVQLNLADLLFQMGEYDAAQEALARIAVAPAANAQEWLRVARIDNVRADIAFQTGDDSAARLVYEAALRALDQPGADHPVERARALGGLGQIELFADAFEDARRLFAQAHDLLLAHFGEDHPDTLWALNRLASAAYGAGDAASAEQQWTRALETGRRIYGERHPEVGTFMHNIALIRVEACRFEAAEPLLRASLDIDRNLRKGDYDDLAYTLNTLALARLGQQASREAETLLLEARAIATKTEHRMLGPILNNLADRYCAADGADKRGIIAEALRANAAEYGENHWRSCQARITAAYCNGGGDGHDGSGVQQDLAVIEARWGEQNLYTQRALQQLAEIARRTGDAAQGRVLQARVVPAMRGWGSDAQAAEAGK